MQVGKVPAGKIRLTLMVIGIIGILAISIYAADNFILPLSFALLILSMVPFYMKFEKKELNAEEMVLMAMLSALAAVGRVTLCGPSQHTSYLFHSNYGRPILRKGSGILVGNTAALISNIFLGQGPGHPGRCWAGE
jgi:energy-coupling factor transport system substrate-specific component